MKPIRALNAVGMPPPELDRLRAVSTNVELIDLGEAAIDQVQDGTAEIVFAHTAPSGDATPALRWLQLSSAGVNHMRDSDVWRRPVTVTNARGVYASPMAEYAINAMSWVSQRVEERRQLQARHEWPSNPIDYECYGLRGKVVVIAGYGTVGRETARLATALGMRVMAIKAHPEVLVDDSFCPLGTGDPEGSLPMRVVGFDEAAELFSLADYVVLTMPLTARTEGLIGRKLLASMRPTAWLINVGRGKVIDEQALIDAVQAHDIGGAWLDVFAQEPLPPESPLWMLPNVVVTPHLSGGNRESFTILTDLWCENLRRYLAGQTLLNVVRSDLGY